MAARVTGVRLRDYRSIAWCDVRLQPLTLLVGPNGSGKSNFLDALRLLAASVYTPLEQVLESRSGIRSILRKLPGGKNAESFSVGIDFEVGEIPGHYSLTVSERYGGALIEKEHCKFGAEEFVLAHGSLVRSSVAVGPDFTRDRPALVSLGSLPHFAPVLSLIAGFASYAPNPSVMRRPTTAGAGKVLSRDASNAPDVLMRIERERPDLSERIRGYLQLFNPEFREVVASEQQNYRWLSFVPTLNPSQWALNSSEVSDGTLRVVGILLAIFQGAIASPPITLVGLEEPESNLHPAAAGVLLDALLEASGQVPIIASTHSADLLDRKDLPEDCLLVVALQDGETVIGQVDDSSRAILRKRLYTAGELLRSNQLNPATTRAER